MCDIALVKIFSIRAKQLHFQKEIQPQISDGLSVKNHLVLRFVMGEKSAQKRT